ncbi:YihY/virulence factor BrkB family protein [Halopelagius longus]|uniref:Membrane protein n=1 Tax=Halopelagius longus TaxID=1236180 RepID=A0A1H0Z6R8_9EURY|nr:YihY/virulence factor BrkB family protein [Halopelagius longus]RDI72858.1 YihY/virulence factor BrkB family protein [Halopelagius longus]SDQ23094.1 membrane protein [Halopelagius longus]
MVSFGGAKRTGKHIASDFSNKNVTFMAAGIAYNAFVSLVPMLLLLLLVVSTFGGGLEARLVTLAEGSLPGPIADVVTSIFGGESAAGASAVGLVVLVWGTLKIFRGLDTAFSEIYETVGQNSLVDQVKDGLVVLLALVVAVVATAGASIVFAWLSDQIPYIGVLTPLVLVGGLLIAFLPMYVRFPDADLGWKDALPGAAFAAVGWAALQALFQVYLSFKGGGSEGFFGGVIVVVTWLYFSGMVLLLGAVINSVLAGESSGRAGGVGMGASGYETRREEELDADEFARYLSELREDVTGRYEEMRPMIGEDGDERRPRPRGEVTVIEQSKRDGDEEEWSVAFRWRSPADGSDRERTPAPADD